MQDKTMKVFLVGIIVIAVIVLVAVLVTRSSGNEGRVNDPTATEILGFGTTDDMFVITARNLSAVAIEAENDDGQITEIGRDDSADETDGGVQEFMIPLPEPGLYERLYAVGYDEEGEEVVRREYSESGAADIYSDLFLSSPLERVTARVGEEMSVEGGTIEVLRVVQDEECDEEACRGGRDTQIEVRVTTDAETETVTVGTTDRITPVAGYFVFIEEVTPEVGEAASDEDYEFVIAVSQDVKA